MLRMHFKRKRERDESQNHFLMRAYTRTHSHGAPRWQNSQSYSARWCRGVRGQLRQNDEWSTLSRAASACKSRRQCMGASVIARALKMFTWVLCASIHANQKRTRNIRRERERDAFDGHCLLARLECCWSDERHWSNDSDFVCRFFWKISNIITIISSDETEMGIQKKRRIEATRMQLFNCWAISCALLADSGRIARTPNV